MDSKTLKEIEQACDEVIKEPKHGEVIVKIKNGSIYRILLTKDKLLV